MWLRQVALSDVVEHGQPGTRHVPAVYLRNVFTAPEGNFVFVGHESVIYVRGRTFVTIYVRWKRPRAGWQHVAFEKVILPIERAVYCMSRIAFPLLNRLQAGGDATEEDIMRAFETVAS